MTTIAQLDTRGRLSLGRMATSETYVVTVETGGRIILDPAVVVTRAEERLLSDEGLRVRVAAAMDNPGPGSPRPARRSPEPR